MARFVPFIVDAGDNQKIGVKITRMKKTDAAQTEKEPHWQTSWMSEYIQSNSFEKYAMKTADGELVALAAYEILESPLPSFGGAPRYELSGEAAMKVFVMYLK